MASPTGTASSSQGAAQNKLEVPEGYVEQYLSQRYLKSRILEEYIQARPEEFGDSPGFAMLRDHHQIIVLRPLRDDEILQLQYQSYPAHFANKAWT